MYSSYRYSNLSERLYPPPGSFKYNTPKPVRNGSAYRPCHDSEEEEEINCDKLTACIRCFISSPIFKLKFWKIVILIVLVVTTGHFSTVVMFHRITEPLFVVKYDSIAKVRQGTSDYLQSPHRKMNNLVPVWLPDKSTENDDSRKLKRKLYLNNSTQMLHHSVGSNQLTNNSNPNIKDQNNSISYLSKDLNPKDEEEAAGLSATLKKNPLPILGSREKSYNGSLTKQNTNLKLCPPIPPNLEGPVKVTLNNIPSLEIQEKLHPELSPGGRFQPTECRARHKVAIIIPFRDRAAHLAVFLHNIHPFLQKQQIDYAIYIVEQAGSGKFNRAMLMNVGSLEALKLYPYDCFIFHDVDLIPEDDRNLYTCPVQPRHMSVAINTMKYKLPYNDIFGGVSAMTAGQFKTVNGFSNKFWGWGGEDDDMSNRIKFHGFYISRYPANVARYTMMSHKKDHPNPQRYKYLNEGKKRYSNDGLNNVKYKVLDIQYRKLFTWFYVELKKT